MWHRHLLRATNQQGDLVFTEGEMRVLPYDGLESDVCPFLWNDEEREPAPAAAGSTAGPTSGKR
jgi:hypothetical protein